MKKSKSQKKIENMPIISPNPVPAPPPAVHLRFEPLPPNYEYADLARSLKSLAQLVNTALMHVIEIRTAFAAVAAQTSGLTLIPEEKP